MKEITEHFNRAVCALAPAVHAIPHDGIPAFKRARNLLALAGLILAPALSQGAIYTVTNSGPSAFTTNSLAWCVKQANENPGPDTVRFSVGTGPVIINLPDTLYIDGELVLDATTQPGYDGKPAVMLHSGAGPLFCMLYIGSLSPNTTVRGLAFHGVSYQATLQIHSSGARIEKCWFGVDRDLNAVGSHNIAVKAGLSISSTINSNLIIDECLFGNVRTAIEVNKGSNARITDNAIGTDFSGAAKLPLHGIGIRLVDCVDTYISSKPAGQGNIIANCGADGIATVGSADTVIINNRIFDCVGMPIDFESDGQTDFPDPTDADNATGGEQNYPRITEVVRADGTISVSGTLNSRPTTNYLIEVYASDYLRMGSFAEMKYKVGVLTGVTNGAGDLTFNGVFVDTLPPSGVLYYAATATRSNQSHGTSGLSSELLATYEQHYRESGLDTASGWIPSGIDSGPEYGIDPTSPDDVDLHKGTGALHVTVRQSPGRNRIAGWTNPTILQLPSQVGAGLIMVRGKFYVYASNAMDAPLNTVPSFRARIENEGAILASTTFQYSMTGRSGPSWEPYYGTLNNPAVESIVGPSLRPSNSAAKPSLYRVDYVPPVNTNQANTWVGASFESMATEDPADGVLSLTEVQLATYQIDATTGLNLLYAPDSNFAAATNLLPPGVPYSVSSGQFNAEGDFQAGRRQALDLPGEVPLTQLATITETPGQGTLLDTANVPADKIGAGLLSITPDVETTTPRVSPDKMHIAMFFLSSDMPAVASTPGEEVQGAISMQMVTGGGAVTSRLELAGPASMVGPQGSPAYELLKSAIPGLDCQNWLVPYYPYPLGERGGTYVIALPPPLSYDTRPLTPGDLGPWGAQPGPGELMPSLRDISIGVNVISQPSTLRLNPTLTVPWAEPNRARVRVSGMLVATYPMVDDGGYDY